MAEVTSTLIYGGISCLQTLRRRITESHGECVLMLSATMASHGYIFPGQLPVTILSVLRARRAHSLARCIVSELAVPLGVESRSWGIITPLHVYAAANLDRPTLGCGALLWLGSPHPWLWPRLPLLLKNYCSALDRLIRVVARAGREGQQPSVARRMHVVLCKKVGIPLPPNLSSISLHVFHPWN